MVMILKAKRAPGLVVLLTAATAVAADPKSCASSCAGERPGYQGCDDSSGNLVCDWRALTSKGSRSQLDDVPDWTDVTHKLEKTYM